MNQHSRGPRSLSTSQSTPIILASSSPRRRELLDVIGLPFQVIPSAIEERPDDRENPSAFARRAALDKALDVSSRNPGRCVLGADTVVDVDGVIFGKPVGNAGAEEMLRILSGREHLVHTGIALVVDGRNHAIVDTARVRFFDLDDGVVTWYVNSGEPIDKAGAYAVQGKGALLVAEIHGSPQTVIGLPVHRLPELFSAQGLDFWNELR